MYYKKPSGITYTQMCIWIDNHVYTDNCDDSILFEYLYHIVRMLAYKRRFFEKSSYYDDFAIYAATRIFLRLRDKRQFEENGELSKIKSVLNYSKNILYAVKVSFESDAYAQNYIQSDSDVAIDTNFHSFISNSINQLNISNFKTYFGDISKTIRAFINKLPHNNKIYLDNLYISCVLSILNSITLSSRNEEKFSLLKNTGKLKPEHIDKFYRDERENCTILYHLDLSLKGYVRVLVNELMHIISKDLTLLLHEDIQPEANIKNVIMSSITMDLKGDDFYS